MITIPHHLNNPPSRGRRLQLTVNTALSSRLGNFLNNSAIILVLFILLQLFFGCMSVVYYEGNYNGKVIDSETLQPIEGAVVIGVWSKVYETAGGSIHEFYDSREKLTNKNGEFSIKGMGPGAMTHLIKMKIVIFKAGYQHIDKISWEELKAEEQVLWEGDNAIIPLTKLSLEQRRKRLVPYVGGKVPKEKQKLFRKEITKEINEINE